MFEVKFATNDLINADSVNEDYRPSSAGGMTPQSPYSLSIEGSAGEHGLDYFKDIVSKEGALGKITVSAEGAVCLEYTDYTVLNSISMRVLSTGEKRFNVFLSKPIGE